MLKQAGSIIISFVLYKDSFIAFKGLSAIIVILRESDKKQ